jgi:hypothetical protein
LKSLDNPGLCRYNFSISLSKPNLTVEKEGKMKKKKEIAEAKKVKYLKPVLTKHKRLRDITALKSARPVLGCTKL